MAVAAATHHSYDRSCAHACTQTDLARASVGVGADVLVPQMVDNVMDSLRLLDLPIAEQVIDVPKISCSPCPSRCPISEPQSAEQLVEVPTVPTPTRLALRIAEQIVDISPSGGGLGHGASSSAGPADEDFTGIFRTFPHGKKCGVLGRSVRTCPCTSAHGPQRLKSSPWGSMSR